MKCRLYRFMWQFVTELQLERPMHTMERSVFWSDWDSGGLQHLHLTHRNKEILATGTMLSFTDAHIPFHATYHILCDEQWCVRSVQLALHHTQSTTIALKADGKGHWTDEMDVAIPALEGCIDVDISTTPFTNTLPIRRLKLALGASANIPVVYLQVPEMTIEPVEQRYAYLEQTATTQTYLYDGLTSNFQAAISVDQDGLVLDYPQLFRRIVSNEH